MIKIRVDIAACVRGLDDVAYRQVPFATVLTLNRLANDGQEAERERIAKAFRLRKETWNLRGVYIANEDRATKAKPRVVIQIEAKRSHFEKFEEGGEKVPVAGRKFLAVPNPKVFGRRILKADDPLRPKNLHLHKDDHGRIIGDQRTFVVPTTNGQQAIMQRVGRRLVVSGKGSLGRLTLDNFAGGMGPRTKKERYSVSRTEGVRTLYQLVKRVKVKASLQFVETITREVQAKTAARFEEGFMQATRTAR